MARLTSFSSELCLLLMAAAQTSDTTATDGDRAANGGSPFDDAVAVWHMTDQDSDLVAHGSVKLGVELEDTERSDSIMRGGDACVAEFHGGYLVAASQDSRDSGATQNPEITGKQMTFCIRMRDFQGAWNKPLFGRCDQRDPLSNILYGVDVDAKPLLLDSPYYLFVEGGEDQKEHRSRSVLEFQWRTKPVAQVVERFRNRAADEDPIVSDARNGTLPLRVPIAQVGPTDWHDVVVRFDGPNLEMFIDGVLVDEDWPHGSLHRFAAPFIIGAGFSNGKRVDGFHGQIDHVALWNRALTDDEIDTVSGGKDKVAIRERETLGQERASLQYWRPRGYNTYAGDCMLLFHNERLHLFWLFDRRHHSSKWHLGAHQYAHASTTDLMHWEHHPLAVPIVEQWECAMGTGDFIHTFDHEELPASLRNKYYAFYTDCGDRCQFTDKPHQGSGIFMSTSTDGIHYTKQPGPVAPGGDCTIFLDESTGLFHLLTPGSTEDGQHGTIDYVSPDLKNWTKQERLFHESAGCCPHHFRWNEWYYFTIDGRFWKSQTPLGPWTLLCPERLDHPSLAYPKTAGFKDNRWIAAGWVGDKGWGGDLIFRELVQHADGSLGTEFPPEMIPASGESVALSLIPSTGGPARNVEGDGRSIRIDAPNGLEAEMVTGVPQNARITLKVEPESDSACFGLCIRASDSYQEGCEIRLEPARQRVQLGSPGDSQTDQDSDYAIDDVQNLDQPFVLDLVMQDDIVDVCIDNRRTIVKRCANLHGDRLYFFARHARVTFDSIEIRPLL